MKQFLSFIVFCFVLLNIKAQQSFTDSLHRVLLSAKEDSTKATTLSKLSEYYSMLYPDSALWYADKLIEFSNDKKYDLGKALGLINKAEALDRIADYATALESALQSLEIAKNLPLHRSFVMGRSYSTLGHLYGITNNPKESVPYLHTAAELLQESGENPEYLYYTYFQMAYSMWIYDKPDSALFYVKKGRQFLEAVKKLKHPTPWLITGNVYRYVVKNIDSSEFYYREGIRLSGQFNSLFLSAVLYFSLGNVFFEKKKMDSCLYYVHKSLELSQKYKYRLFEINASGFLAYIYDSTNVDSAFKYLKIMGAARSEVFNSARGQQFQKAASDAEKKEKELENAKLQSRNKFRTILLIIVLTFVVSIALLFWRNNRHRKKANLLLAGQNEKVEKALKELKSAQSQLIQSEKMASLGELTAGIAHEIQNPLNFMNNFSEVNTELIDEMNEEMERGNLENAKTIANDIKENEQKISHHGKRADAIVKGMLQHSQKSTGQKQPTDINKLADEYLRLSYHGLRAKDKSFNAILKTEFDESIGNTNIIPQDIGRVILNIITNAFYAVAEKKKQMGDGYEPTVSVSTKKINGHIEINVKDNGTGVPQKVVEKIFQPFFTTKPTGNGTGLGLSLAYDIVKAHGGEIKVTTEENQGSAFTISLPL